MIRGGIAFILVLLLSGCIVIPLAAMVAAKLAFEGHKAAECEKAPDRCNDGDR